METELTIKNKHYSSYSRIRKGVWSLRCWYPTQARQPHTLVVPKQTSLRCIHRELLKFPY